MALLETRRLRLRHLASGDAAFILELLNDPACLLYVGDKRVRTTADARQYLEAGPAASYAEHGFGLYCVVHKNTDAPIGICGLLRREALPEIDIDFALLNAHRQQGYAAEAARAVLAEARTRWQLKRIVAITQPDNTASVRTLQSLGFALSGEVAVPGCGRPLHLNHKNV